MRKIQIKLAAGALALLLLTTGAPGMAANSVATRSLNPDRIFRFDPPAQDQAIQAFDFGAGKDVYIAQQVGEDTRLSRCTRTSTGTCTQRDSVMLRGYGHGESLEVYTKKGRTYIWIGSTSNGIPPYYFSHTISLIEYKKARAGSKKASYHRVGMLKNLAAIVPESLATPFVAMWHWLMEATGWRLVSRSDRQTTMPSKDWP